jgi:hypothetical protein
MSRQLLTESHGWHRNIDVRQGGEWSSARDGEEEEDSKGDEDGQQPYSWFPQLKITFPECEPEKVERNEQRGGRLGQADQTIREHSLNLVLCKKQLAM